MTAMAWIAIGTAPAAACSCEELTVAAAMDRGDPMFVGELLNDPRVADEELLVPFRFRVDGWLLGAHTAEEVVIASESSGSVCGFDHRPGAEVAVVFHETDDGLLRGGSCESMSASAARRQAAALGLTETAPVSGVIGDFDGPGGGRGAGTLLLATLAVVAAGGLGAAAFRGGRLRR